MANSDKFGWGDDDVEPGPKGTRRRPLPPERLARFGWNLDKDEIVFVHVPDDDEEPAQEPEPTPRSKPQGR